jgi:galactose mutarotase-like enzyme
MRQPANLTQHSYFNLGGTGDVLAHCLAINASTYRRRRVADPDG